ncbi:RagB/SusD family nutrient uptake outer membrane protein [Pleomorphovibrio marinus]|uniref:RagB/SusD family nutrient uptake outer membrane protein n=1 Tax=Pleomorphovibrio marinus TaxID=2164132 RepID=UPI000E0ACD4C|nr:RagB/SusD family nutrient uptake outer membrane protein [Pleomorphovibrio marinus]
MKAIKNITIWIGLAACTLISYSCNDTVWLEDVGTVSNGFVEPRNTMDLEQLVNGALWVAGGEGGFRGIHGNQAIYSATIADAGKLMDGLGVVGQDAIDWYNRDFSNNAHAQPTRNWQAGYAVLLAANAVIDWVEENGPFEDANTHWTPRILGEAHWLRAWVNFAMVRIFAPPYGANNEFPAIILKDRMPSGAFDNPGLSSVEEIYQQILFDLDRALELLPEQYSPDRDPPAFVDRQDRMAAHFLAMRVYFQMRDWQRAEEHADVVLNSGRFPLDQDPIEAWNKDQFGDKGNEVVFQYVTSGPQTNWKPPVISRWLGYADPNGRWNFSNFFNNNQIMSLSEHFKTITGWNDHEEAMNDKRYSQLFLSFEAGEDPRPVYQALNQREVWAHKWYRAGEAEASNRVASLPLMRSAEAYLTRAFLRFMGGNDGGAREDLNVVRRRAGLEDYTGALSAEVIEVERMKELVFEDDRLYYLQATQQEIPNGDRGSGGISWSDRTWQPIPQLEIDLNPNISRE